MLWAGGALDWGHTAYRSYVALERTFRVFVVERTGTIWDTQFAPTRAEVGPGRAVVYVLLSGWMSWTTPALRLEAPAIVVTTEESVDGAAGARAITFRAGGEPFRSVELRVDTSLVRVPVSREPHAVSVTATTFAACEAVAAAFAAQEQPTEAAVRALEQLVADGILDAGVIESIARDEPPHFRRTWEAVRGMYMRLDTAPSLQAIADGAGISLRQLARDIEDLCRTFLTAEGFRDETREIRLRWAVLLLSAPSLRIQDVAKACGYGSTAALSRAFRDASLPAPGRVRRALIGDSV